MGRPPALLPDSERAAPFTDEEKRAYLTQLVELAMLDYESFVLLGCRKDQSRAPAGSYEFGAHQFGRNDQVRALLANAAPAVYENMFGDPKPPHGAGLH